jgi:hypothetical protein
MTPLPSHSGSRQRGLWRPGLLALGLGLLAACAQPPTAPPREAPAPAPAPAPVEPPAPPQPAPLSAAEIPRTISAAIEQLEAGQDATAETELRRVLQADPNNRLAQSLLQQIKDDPLAVLGRESFSYKVQPGESLSKIAQRFLNDVHLFYILARYNNIKVPRSLAGGQVIRVPGKAPPAGTVTPPQQAVAPVVVPPPPPQPDNTVVSEKAKAEAVARHTKNARSAFARQDLDASIRSWNEVLKLDPDNRIALLEKDKVMALKDRLTKLK